MLLSSRANPRIKAIRALHERKERERTGLFLAEGKRILEEALRADAEIETLIVVPERLTPDERAVATAALGRARDVLEVTPPVFEAVAFREDERQSLAAVVRRRHDSLPEQPQGERCWVAVDEIQHPGNLGTLIRNCDAAGGAGVILTGASTDPYHPISVRGSLGAIFSQRVVETTAAEFADWTRRYPCQVVGTSPAAAIDYREAVYKPPVVIMTGNERTGLTDEQIGLCQALVSIPMAGVVDSLNLSVAAALVLYEVFRQTS